MHNKILVVVAAATFFTTTTHAQDIVLKDEMSQVTLSGGVGVLLLEGREYVFRGTGSTNLYSLLVWQSTAPLLTASLDVQMPSSWTFGATANFAHSGDSYMEDYDWMVPRPGRPDMSNWSHRSQHPNTSLDWYFNGSMQLGYNLHLDDDATVNLHVGIEYTDVKWAAVDSTYIYSSSTGFRDITGSYTGPIISYRQQLPSLFAGANGTLQRDKWTFNIGAKAGITFAGKAIDWHWARDLRFDENVYPAPVLGVNASLEYQVADQLSFVVGGEVNRVFLGRSDTAMTAISTGAPIGSSLNASGAELLSGTFKVGLSGRF